MESQASQVVVVSGQRKGRLPCGRTSHPKHVPPSALLSAPRFLLPGVRSQDVRHYMLELLKALDFCHSQGPCVRVPPSGGVRSLLVCG